MRRPVIRLPRPGRYWLLWIGIANAGFSEFTFIVGPLDRWAVCVWPFTVAVLLLALIMAWRTTERLLVRADALEEEASRWYAAAMATHARRAATLSFWEGIMTEEYRRYPR